MSEIPEQDLDTFTYAHLYFQNYKIFNIHVSPPFREPIQLNLFTSILWLEICQCNNSVTILDTVHHVVTTVFSTAVSKKVFTVIDSKMLKSWGTEGRVVGKTEPL